MNPNIRYSNLSRILRIVGLTANSPAVWKRALAGIGALGVLVCATGCNKKPEIQVYRLEKAPMEADASTVATTVGPGGAGSTNSGGSAAMPAPAAGAMPPMAGMPGMPGGAAAVPPAEMPATTSTPPAGWVSQPPSAMRLASFLAKGADGAVVDISLVTLGGAAGGVLENVNRWLNQLGQPPIADDKLAAMATHATTPLGDATVVDLTGLSAGADAKKDGRIIGALVPDGERTFFFKMRGNAALAGDQKEAFIKWIGTVRLADQQADSSGATQPVAPMAPAVQSDHPPFASAGAMPPVAAPGQDAAAADAQSPISWTLPDGWKSGQGSSMRYATLTVPGADGDNGEVSVVTFAGDGGDDLANVNRWRGQLGLGPVDADGLKPMIVPLQGTVPMQTVDLTGTGKRMIVGWTRHTNHVWFFKLTGSDTLATVEKPKFVQFLQSVKFQP